MFLTASKTAVVEAMRDVYDDDYAGDISFRSIDIEYPDQEYKWPSCLVQLRLDGPVQWTGINPNHQELMENGNYRDIRLGDFRGSFDFTVLALTSQERDILWDGLVELFLFGDMRSDTDDFLATIDTHDLIRMTTVRDQVQPIGDSIGPGVPWNNTLLAYEATLRVPMIGQFAANQFDRELVPLSAVTVTPYRENEPVPGDGDGLGPWFQ